MAADGELVLLLRLTWLVGEVFMTMIVTTAAQIPTIKIAPVTIAHSGGAPSPRCRLRRGLRRGPRRGPRGGRGGLGRGGLPGCAWRCGGTGGPSCWNGCTRGHAVCAGGGVCAGRGVCAGGAVAAGGTAGSTLVEGTGVEGAAAGAGAGLSRVPQVVQNTVPG